MSKLIEVTFFSKENLWFKNGKVRLNPNPDFSSHRVCKTIKTARRVAKGILNRWPDTEVVILRWTFKDNGQKFAKTETWKMSK